MERYGVSQEKLFFSSQDIGGESLEKFEMFPRTELTRRGPGGDADGFLRVGLLEGSCKGICSGRIRRPGGWPWALSRGSGGRKFDSAQAH